MKELRKIILVVASLAISICFAVCGDRGWFHMSIDKAANHNLLDIHTKLAKITDDQYKLIGNQKTNIACFSLFVDGEELEGKHKELIFCSNDSVNTNSDQYKLFKMMASGGNYNQCDFFNHQKAMIDEAESFFKNNESDLKSELEQYKSIIKNLKDKLDKTFARVNTIVKEIVNVEPFVQDLKAVGLTENNFDALLNFLEQLNKHTEIVKKAKNDLFSDSDGCLNIKTLFHSEQRILYYLLRNGAVEFFKLINRDKDNPPKTITLHLHTHKDPCEICGPVLCFANILMSKLVKKEYGNDVNFELVVSCSELRNEFIAECGNFNLKAVYSALVQEGGKQRRSADSEFDENSFNSFVAKNLAILFNKNVEMSIERRTRPRYPLIFLEEKKILEPLDTIRENEWQSIDLCGFFLYNK